MKNFIFLILLSISFSVSASTCRSQAVVREFNKQHGYSKNPKGKIVDHICPLVCGGLDITENMQYQSVIEAKVKDKWESTARGCHQLCNSSNSKPVRTVFNCK